MTTRGVHNWTQDEITLVEDVAARTWTSLERARAETALLARRLHWVDIVSPQGRERDDQAYEELKQRGHYAPYERNFRHKVGRLIPLLLGGGRFDDRAGVGVLFAVDLSARKQVEDSLRTSEERLRLAIETAHFGAHSYDRIADRLWWAPEVYALTGVASDQPVSLRTIEEVIHPGDWGRIRSAIDASLDPADSGLFAEEFRVIRADNGETRWLVNRARTLFDETVTPRRALRVVGVIMDVTDRRQVEEALRRADRQKDEFLAMLGHELRNPLAPIRNAGETLEVNELMEQALDILQSRGWQIARAHFVLGPTRRIGLEDLRWLVTARRHRARSNARCTSARQAPSSPGAPVAGSRARSRRSPLGCRKRAAPAPKYPANGRPERRSEA